MVALLKGEHAKLHAENIRNDSFLQKFFLSWVYGVVWKGQSNKLNQDELRMPANQATEVAVESFDRIWQDELDLQKQGKEPSLFRALRKAYGRELLIAGIWKFLWSCFVILGAFYFTRSLIDFVKPLTSDRNMYNKADIPNKGVGWILSLAFFIDSWLVGLSLQRMTDTAVRLGIKARAALMIAVYRKTFKLADTHGDESGNIVALVATDCQKVYNGCQAILNVLTAPIETAAIIALLLWLNGKYGLPAVGVIVVVLPLQYYFGYLIAKYKTEGIEVSDARINRMHEVLLAIKLVKFYVWERSFAEQVSKVREEEMKNMAKTAVVKTLNLCLVFAVPPVIAIVIYSTYAFAKGTMDSATAFTVLSLFNTLRFPLVVLPKALRGSSEAITAVKRLQNFLMQPETELNKPSSQVEARIVDAELVHPRNPDEFKLAVPKFEVYPGEVVAVVGRVGCGKSSLFHAILGNMVTRKGEVKVGGTIAYVPQTPWVQNLTLRDNILFGLPYDEAKYRKVVHACALELDFDILPKGDFSMAGERGINLSGGQRQRICLARAAYHCAELILMDNPLSAVDQHTAKHIFDHCIKGLMKDKAVVLITHQLELLPLCNKVGIIKDGGMVCFGPYDANAMNSHMPVDHLLFATVESGDSATKKPSDSKLVNEDEDESEIQRTGDLTRRRSMQRNSSDAMQPVSSVHMLLHELEQQESAAEQHLETVLEACEQSPEEVAAQFNGVVPRLSAFKALKVYIHTGGVMLFVISIMIFAMTQTMRVWSDYWIRLWAADQYGWKIKYGKHDAIERYILYYMAFVVSFIVLLLCRDAGFCALTIRTSKRLHNRLFYRVLQARFIFFLRTPVGDVLNAFSKDLDTVDESLVDTVHMSTIYLMILLTTLAIVTVNLHYYGFMALFLFVVFFIMQNIYLPAATVLKRWAGDTASQVYVHVDESLHGMELIRAFDAVDYFIQDCIQRINVHHLALFNTEQTHLWLAFWCDFFGAVLVVVTALMSVGLKGHVKPAAVGLAISNSIQLLVFFTWVVRGMADSVSMWDSVERIASFVTNIPSELEGKSSQDTEALPAPTSSKKAAADSPLASKPDALKPWINVSTAAEPIANELAIVEIKGKTPDIADMTSWPKTGDIHFDAVCLRYVPGAPLALRGVSFHIKDKEKVGVVGRTGSGKTTLLMALFRMFELAGGRIVIDGVDIAALPLQDLRKRIAIIPQEPVMFKGSVRSNLDPFSEKKDADLWEALRLVNMKDAITAAGGLDAPVQEGGSNFSLGHKQLICMARCVLKDTKVLVLDEATAAMDLQTDALIQTTIRKVFKGRTTVTIAHRLDTIIFSDKILAMSSGQKKEFDSPLKLLKNPKSLFAHLVEDTGPLASATLKKMAQDGPQDS